MESREFSDKCICHKSTHQATNMFCSILLSIIGFGVRGVVKGSLAVLWQSFIGNVASGSFFALLQSLGATAGLLVSLGK